VGEIEKVEGVVCAIIQKCNLSGELSALPFSRRLMQYSTFQKHHAVFHSDGHSLKSWGNGNRGMTHSLFWELWGNGNGNEIFERTLRLSADFRFWNASESERQVASKNHEFFRCSSLSKMSVLVLENNDELRHHPSPPSLQWPLFSVTVRVGACCFFLRENHYWSVLTPPFPQRNFEGMGMGMGMGIHGE